MFGFWSVAEIEAEDFVELKISKISD